MFTEVRNNSLVIDYLQNKRLPVAYTLFEEGFLADFLLSAQYFSGFFLYSILINIQFNSVVQSPHLTALIPIKISKLSSMGTQKLVTQTIVPPLDMSKVHI